MVNEIVMQLINKPTKTGNQLCYHLYTSKLKVLANPHIHAASCYAELDNPLLRGWGKELLHCRATGFTPSAHDLGQGWVGIQS